MNRLEQRRRNVQAIAAKKRAATHCKYEHEFTPENTYWRKDGRRACKTCCRDRRYYQYHGIAWAR